MLHALPDDLRRQICLHLHAPSVLNLLSTDRDHAFRFGVDPSLWLLLLRREGIFPKTAQGEGNDIPPSSHVKNDDNDDKSSSSSSSSSCGAKILRHDFLRTSQLNTLHHVQWRPVRQSPPSFLNIRGTRGGGDGGCADITKNCHPCRREGHMMCVLPQQGNYHRLVLTGGFCDDVAVYVLDVPKSAPPSSEVASSPAPAVQGAPGTDGWKAIRPTGPPPSFAYGSSLTPLDSTRAIRFGGFRAGLYNSETDEVFLLTLTEEPHLGKSGRVSLVARWQRINCQVAMDDCRPRPRGYHTATLLSDRYLLVLGGMTSTSRGSILEEAVLDVETWTWLPGPVSSSSVPQALPSTKNDGALPGQKPSGRHGHSVVFDQMRNRLVLFGGGSGTDLLRSGVDNAEVWELSTPHNWDVTGTKKLEETFPWSWRLLHPDNLADSDDLGSDEDMDRDENDVATPKVLSSTMLTPNERRCLGRCHVGVLVSPHTALLFSGSSRSSTNGVLGYDLCQDVWIRPKVSGRLPMPRFTAAGTCLEYDGWLVVHGGYSSLYEGCLGDVVVLDLAPLFPNGRKFPCLEVSSEEEEEEGNEDGLFIMPNCFADNHLGPNL